MKALLRKLLLYILSDSTPASTDPAALDKIARSLKK